MIGVCKGSYSGNVGTAVMIEVGDCDCLDDGVNLSCRLNPPLLRGVEADSSSDSLFTATTRTDIQKLITQTALVLHVTLHLFGSQLIEYLSLK
jgi:hypothetical protein